LYALVRTRTLWPAVCGCVVAAVGAGILVRQTVIVGSTQSGGRSLDEVAFYSARVGDFFARHVDHGRSEQFVYLGWLTPLLALAGFVLLVRERRRGLAIVLGVGALVPVLLALGTRFPLYTVLWHALPPFRFPRVPERRQRPGGYSTTAPKSAKALARRLERLNCGDWSGNTGAVLRRLGVTAIAFHRGLFVNNQAVPETTYFALRGLQEHGWTVREA